ncbi:MAG: hypothetical protein HDR22_11655 [Lachnospiraceae bacterium]|nr:hypothetical protein [Lachnospiraceae bacterium]
MITILMQKYNDKKAGLIDFIYSAKEDNISLSDEEIWEIRNSLSVRSIEEVAEHFQPEVKITLEGEQICIPLCHKEGFFWKVIRLWETIRRGEYTDITEAGLEDSMFMKDSVTEEEFVKAQEEIFVYLQKNKFQQAQEQLKRCTELFEDTLFLSKRLLKRGEQYLQENESEHRRFVVEADGEAALQCIAVSEAFRKSCYHTKQIEEQYQQLLTQMAQPKHRLLYWNMILACSSLSEEKRGQLKLFWNEVTRDYEEARKKFWWQAKPMIQTLFNCYLYFSRPEADELLITNCSVEELADLRYKKELQRYLETVNRKQYQEDAIGNAILPNIRDKKKQEKPIRQRFPAGKKEEEKHDNGNLDEAKILENILEQYGIKTRMFLYEEGEPLGYVLTGIDVLKQMPGNRNEEENKLRSLTIWLDELKLQREE